MPMHPEPRRLHRAAIGVYVLKTVRDGALPLLIVVVLGVLGGGLDAAALARGALFAGVGFVIATATAYARWSSTRWWVNADGVRLLPR